MKIAVISFSQRGCVLGKQLEDGLKMCGHQVRTYLKSKYADEKAEEVWETIGEWTEKRFCDSEAILFIGACGIAVRSIAPFVKSKQTDPAVVVTDETGAFVISLLSGHLGGANELTEQAAKILGAQAVITTATDRNGKFAVDTFAKKNGCAISDMKLAKEVSAALLAGETIGFYSDFLWSGKLPEGLMVCGGAHPGQVEFPEASAQENASKQTVPQLGICVTCHTDRQPFAETLYLIPKIVTVGIGCRKGTNVSRIREAIYGACKKESVFTEAIEQAASIDLKQEEAGILQYCQDSGLPFYTYSAEQLREAEGNFTKSEFVKGITGVENVCERAAVLGSTADEPGRLLCRKYIGNGATAALAQKKWSVKF